MEAEAKHDDKSASAKSAGKCRSDVVLHLITIITWLLSPSNIFQRTGIVTSKFLQSSCQMTVVSNCTIAIATLSDWLKNLTPVFSTNEKQKQNQPHLVCAVFPAL